MKIGVRQAKFHDVDQVMKVLNEATADLISKGINQWSYPWESEMIKNEITFNHCFVLEVDQVVGGTFFISDIDSLSQLPIEPGSKYLSKMAILPELQGNGFGAKMIAFACSFAKNKGSILYLDCWAGNDKLKSFYSHNGLEYVGDFPEEDYFISVFRSPESNRSAFL
ncbi:GNAT family N-acetyltransferase [Cohnella nanjingensis]|uniref:GNAT family N-acetyltransferase n=1 Tax=Cohnella nanjingensis TaxID=1387779 RepID=A0A7X0VHT1_9BACL|nr:GNAT family N-acetyltransferase [Cohnella nanjingensis]MBB6673793.1 GNAT family N-acetyltransferase [Cohnella nanjingensis]